MVDSTPEVDVSDVIRGANVLRDSYVDWCLARRVEGEVKFEHVDLEIVPTD